MLAALQLDYRPDTGMMKSQVCGPLELSWNMDLGCLRMCLSIQKLPIRYPKKLVKKINLWSVIAIFNIANTD